MRFDQCAITQKPPRLAAAGPGSSPVEFPYGAVGGSPDAEPIAATRQHGKYCMQEALPESREPLPGRQPSGTTTGHSRPPVAALGDARSVMRHGLVTSLRLGIDQRQYVASFQQGQAFSDVGAGIEVEHVAEQSGGIDNGMAHHHRIDALYPA